MPLGITAHRLSGTERGIDCHPVSAATQLGDDRLAPGPLHMKLIRLPLMMKARGSQGLTGRFLEVDGLQDGQEGLRNNGRPTGRTHAEHRLTISEHQRRAHARERPLACLNGIGFGTHQAEEVRHTRLGREVVHVVVEQDAGARHDDLAAKARIERGGARHPVALGVRGREVRSVPVPLPGKPLAVGLGRGAGRRDDRGSIETDPPCQVDRVLLGHQSPGHTHEVRITQPTSPIGEGQLHRLGDDMGQFGRTVAHSGEVEVLEDVKDLDDMDSA